MYYLYYKYKVVRNCRELWYGYLDKSNRKHEAKHRLLLALDLKADGQRNRRERLENIHRVLERVRRVLLEQALVVVFQILDTVLAQIFVVDRERHGSFGDDARDVERELGAAMHHGEVHANVVLCTTVERAHGSSAVFDLHATYVRNVLDVFVTSRDFQMRLAMMMWWQGSVCVMMV